MLIDPNVLVTFGLLALAVLLLWTPPAPRAVPLAVALACVTGLAGHLLDWRAPVAIACYAAIALAARRAAPGWRRTVLLFATGIGAFLFALHRMPGFYNPVLAAGVQFSDGAPPFRLHANFDTAVAGIVLMAVFCDPIRDRAAWAALLRRVWPVALATVVLVLGVGLALGYVRPDVKWTPYSGWFLASNLLFTCVTEEAFFRGFVLEHVRQGLAGRRWALPAAVAVSTLLFGAAHAGGGALLVLLAAVAGLGYAAAYVRTGRIEGAILAHFLVNGVHFVAFTYPYLAPHG
jgi:membrane protease YdiL (CAAX protease family)